MTASWKLCRSSAERGAVALFVGLVAAYGLSIIVGTERFAALFAFSPMRFYTDHPAVLVHGLISLFTYSAVHADALHLALNCGIVFVAGVGIGNEISARGVVGLFLMGVAAGALVDVILFGPSGGLIGASAGASALLAAWLHTRVEDPRLLAAIGILWLVGNFLAGTTFADPMRAIAWEAHTGGFLAGLAAIALSRRD